MKRFIKPFFIALVIASMFFPWIIKYDVPYPGVMYERYIFGYETVCGWISFCVAIVLIVLELFAVDRKAGITIFLRSTCCMIGILISFIYSMSMFLFENHDIIRPFIGMFTAMISYGLLLVAFSKEKAED